MGRRKKPKDRDLAILRIELTLDAKQRADQIAEERGMTQTAMLSRLAEWFALQPPVVQNLALNQLPADVQPDATRLLTAYATRAVMAGAE